MFNAVKNFVTWSKNQTVPKEKWVVSIVLGLIAVLLVSALLRFVLCLIFDWEF